MIDRILVVILYLIAIIGFARILYFKGVHISIELPFIILGLAKLLEINSKIKE